MTRKKLIEKLAEAAWLVLNFDNDWADGEPCNTANWALLCKRLDAALPKSYQSKPQGVNKGE